MRVRMSWSRCLVAGALVFVVGCGGEAEETAETVAPAPTAPPTTAPATTAPATTAPEPSTPPTTAVAIATTAPADAPSPIQQVASGALELVRAGFAAFDEARPVRVSSLTSQTYIVPALNADSVSTPDEPTVVVESLPNGDSHTLMRVGQLFAPMASGDPELAARMAEIEIEIWVVGDTMTIDSTDYQLIADLNPTFDLGPFSPGIGTIDLARAGDVAGADVAALLVGSSVPDPAELGRTLPAALTSLQQDPADPSRVAGTATYAAVLEAQGGDVLQVARSAAAGVAPSLGVDADELAAAYVEFYESTPTEVIFSLDDDGSLAELTTVGDLSGVWESLFADGSLLTAEIGTDVAESVRSQFAGSVWTMRTDTTFVIDDTIQVVAPVGAFEDRTQIAVTYFESAFGG